VENNERGALGDAFDRTMRALNGIPDVTMTKPTTTQTISPILEQAQTFIVQTARHREQGDTIFVQYIGKDGSFRVALPPAVADVIARQRDAVTTKNRRAGARAAAADRKARGIVPGFMRGKGKATRG
jgi:hypothetical protein